jgi:phosphoribosylformylglycinamidine synthase subunit PurL
MKNSIPDHQPTTAAIADELGLYEYEYKIVCDKLGRVPTYAELGVFSAMFSEHCSYKSSKHALRRFPTTGKRVLQGPGENAGILDVGHGWGVAFKMESHNHPSFIEPFQGAATGVGGILRDIFTMGARPIANMDSLCFGKVDYGRTRAIVKGVVKGIGDYGNCVGVPTVAGQTVFHPCYNQNPLVNAFTVGLIRNDGIYRGYASGPGNLVVYVGSKTGRDGVHGATMASKEFSTEEEPDRPTVQVGDPFTEKLLLEASIEAMQAKTLVGIQDMGAAGLTSSSFEMAHRAGTGLEVDLDSIPTRESGMSAYELLLSESQERMLLVCTPEQYEPLKAIFDKWDLHAEIIGKVVAGDRVVMTKSGKVVVDLPVDLVVNPPMAARPKAEPAHLSQLWEWDKTAWGACSFVEKFHRLTEDFCFAHPGPLVQQYDSMVGNRTEGGTFDDGAVLRLREVKEANLRIALSTDCNPQVCYLWPREGGRRAVAESALNLAVRGAEPIGITDCLNFGNPENPNVMWQFEEAVDGICETCTTLGIPVVSGNVSLYNDTDGIPIYPTPMIGMVGLIEGDHKLPSSTFWKPNLEVALLGSLEGGLGGSRAAYLTLRKDQGKPAETNLPELKKTIELLQQAPRKLETYAAHDLSDGGLATAALEMLFHSPESGLGLELDLPAGVDAEKVFYGEAVPRVLLAFEPGQAAKWAGLAESYGLKLTRLGKTTSDGRLTVRSAGNELLKQDLAPLHRSWKERWKPLFE